MNNRFSVVTDPRGERISMRSRLETHWAKFFSLLGLDWTYEPDVAGFYRPDFQIKTIGFVEIKPTSLYALDHFKRYREFSTTCNLPLFIICGRPTEGFNTVALAWKGKEVKWLNPFDAASMFCFGKKWSEVKKLAAKSVSAVSQECINTGDFLEGYKFLNPVYNAK